MALGFAACEQAGLDGGRWDAAYLLTFVQEPPPAMMKRRPGRHQLSQAASFSPLWDQEWTTVMMAYFRELDLLASRRKEMGTTKGPPSAPQTPPGPKPPPPPPRRPKKGRGKGGEGEAQG